MDEIRNKVFKFVKKQTAVDTERTEPADDSETIRRFACDRSKSEEVPPDDLEDEEVLQQLPRHYFSADPEFDVQHHLLQGLSENVQCSEIKSQLRVLYRQHGVVSKKTLRLILEKESACKGELERISGIQNELNIALTECRGSRLHLRDAKDKFTTKSLGILKQFNRKQIIVQLLNYLRTIRTLQRSDDRLQELLKEGNFPGAIHLLLESRSVAFSLKHFKCVAQISLKLQDTLETTEGQLDTVLCGMCKHFDEGAYSKLQDAYSLLDKTQTVMDQLLMHFTSELHSSIFKVVHGYAHSSSSKQFQQLCNSVPSVDYVACLQAVCQEIWHILNSYYKIMQWHQTRDKETAKYETPGRDIERSLNKQYIKQKLESGQVRLWNDVQSKVSHYIMGHDFSDCKFEDLLQILGALHRLTEIGEELCGSKGEELTRCIRQQTASYFQSYHNSKLEELRIFLENEAWTPCPVRHKFTLLSLQEFKSLRHSIESHRKPKRTKLSVAERESEATNSCSNLSTGESSSCQNLNYFGRYEDGGTPFDLTLDETFHEDFLGSIGEDFSGYYSNTSEDSDCEELKKAYVEDNPQPSLGSANKLKKEKRGSAPLVANTTLTVLRQCGKYLQMCKLLKPIAAEVIFCMCQLLDYYLYNVQAFFASELPVQSSKMVSYKLQAALKRIEDGLIVKSSIQEGPGEKKGIVASRISEMVNLKRKETLYGISERVVGVESLVFLGSQFEYIQPYVFHLVPADKNHFITEFYTQTVACVADIRVPAYMGVSGHVVDMSSTLKEMNNVNFQIKDVTSEHSPYIDKIVRDMQIFSMKLDELNLDIPLEAEKVLWQNILHVVNNILVEGFAGAKKCSNGGRALMLLDYTQLVSKVQKLTPLQKIPNKEFVENYIKAFYLQESMLEEWIAEHREYTPKQLESLVHCSCQNSKKTKLKLLQLLDIGK